MGLEEEMLLQRNHMQRPFVFWLIQELFSGDQPFEEELRPLGDREFYTWMAMIGGALLVYAVVFRSFAA